MRKRVLGQSGKWKTKATLAQEFPGQKRINSETSGNIRAPFGRAPSSSFLPGDGEAEVSEDDEGALRFLRAGSSGREGGSMRTGAGTTRCC